ncbi:MAG: TIGR02587 family membrane protein [Pseudohongiella sp.]|nr:TIGR02587 family membrane protein [Pseudohongiella sp.]
MLSTSHSGSVDSGAAQWRGVGRAVGGAVVFGMPMTMTMEMWWLGFYVDPLRLLCLLIISLPLLVGVSSVIGFTESRELIDNIIDVFVAYAFGFLLSGLSLILFHTASLEHAAETNFTIFMLQAIPASLGALLGRSELGSGEHDRAEEKSQADKFVVLAVGALFLALNVAPTDEIQMIAYQMSRWHLLGLFLMTCLVMYIFVHAGSYSKGSEIKDTPDTFVGRIYHTCLALTVAATISVLLLWVFGKTDGLGFGALIGNVIVLMFPSGIGAAAARLII